MGILGAVVFFLHRFTLQGRSLGWVESCFLLLHFSNHLIYRIFKVSGSSYFTDLSSYSFSRGLLTVIVFISRATYCHPSSLKVTYCRRVHLLTVIPHLLLSS